MDSKKTINDEIANKSLNNINEFLKIREDINGMNVVIGTTKKFEVPILKQLVDNITNTLNNSFVLLANVNKNNVNIICKTNINNVSKKSFTRG